MIGAAARDDGGFLQRPETGRRFASVENFDVVAPRSVNESPRGCCNSGQALQKSQRDAFRFENRTRAAVDLDHRLAGVDFAAVMANHLDRKSTRLNSSHVALSR